MHPYYRTSAFVLLATLALAGSCIDLAGPRWARRTPAASPSDSTPAPPVITSVIRIVTSTTGADPDSDG
jgi:hypothetical protein